MSIKKFEADTFIFTTTSGASVVNIKTEAGKTLILNGTATSGGGGGSGISTLTNGKILIGNVSNVPAEQTVSGDATINNTGVLTLANTAVTAATYNFPTSATVDSKGRLTAISSSLTANYVIIGNAVGNAVSRPISGDISIGDGGVSTLADTGVGGGTYSVPTSVTIDSKGRVTSVSDTLLTNRLLIGNSSNKASAVTVSGDFSISGSGVGTLSNSGVTAGTYSAPTSVTIDSKGRVTSVSDTLLLGNILIGNSLDKPVARTITGDVSISAAGTATLANTGVTAGTYTFPYITVDSKGRITSTGNAINTNVDNAILFNYLGDMNVVPVFTYNSDTTIFTSPSIRLDYNALTTLANVSTGIYSSVSGQLDFCSSGVNNMSMSSTLISPKVQINGVKAQNLLYNGGFQVFQRSMTARSISVLASIGYTFDRWQVSAGSSQQTIVSSQPATISGDFVCRIQRVDGQTGVTETKFGQSLTRNMSISAIGKVVTISFYAKASSTFSPTSKNITVRLRYGTGTSDVSGLGGLFIGNVVHFTATQAITTSLVRYTFTTTAIPTSATQLCLEFAWTPVGTASSDYWELSNVQLEVNPFASDFSYVPFPEEITRCQHFFQLMSTCAGYFSTNAGASQFSLPLQVTMRTTPTLGSVSPSGTYNVAITVTDTIANYTQSSFSITAYMQSANGGSCALGNFTGTTALRPITMYDLVTPFNMLTFSAELT